MSDGKWSGHSVKQASGCQSNDQGRGGGEGTDSGRSRKIREGVKGGRDETQRIDQKGLMQKLVMATCLCVCINAS